MYSHLNISFGSLLYQLAVLKLFLSFKLLNNNIIFYLIIKKSWVAFNNNAVDAIVNLFNPDPSTPTHISEVKSGLI